MAETQAQAAFMETTAGKFESVNGELQSMLKTLLGQLEVLQSAWKGAGGRSFQQVKERWSEDQDKLGRALLTTAQAIRESGKNYTATDSDASSKMGSIHGGGVTLPL
ncbi:WXG100 family type VII secretion target [Hamadaea tsunoensis]|uniref:WXG100 family type VII secretion target n=1 Tax=Hamadaea tsunoensis TaxID=53368 RepID=UPI0004029DB4|nr:WXG100 family type VII secretion target [Hamadaea tsunoensis]